MPPHDEAAARVYIKCQAQLRRTGMGQAIDIDFNAVETAMKRLDIDSNYVFWRVVHLARTFIAREGGGIE